MRIYKKIFSQDGVLMKVSCIVNGERFTLKPKAGQKYLDFVAFVDNLWGEKSSPFLPDVLDVSYHHGNIAAASNTIH